MGLNIVVICNKKRNVLKAKISTLCKLLRTASYELELLKGNFERSVN